MAANHTGLEAKLALASVCAGSVASTIVYVILLLSDMSMPARGYASLAAAFLAVVTVQVLPRTIGMPIRRSASPSAKHILDKA